MELYRYGEVVVYCLVLNHLKSNCYILVKGNDALIIDPVDRSDDIVKFLNAKGLILRYIVSTHGHFDHISAASGLIESGLVDELYIHEKDFLVVSKSRTYSALVAKKKMIVPKISMFDDGVLNFLLKFNLRPVIAGGHTPGSCYFEDLNRNFLFAGDLVLNHKLNITLESSRENKEEFFSFIKIIEDNFNDTSIIFPGHGDITTVHEELKYNKKWKYIREKFDGH